MPIYLNIHHQTGSVTTKGYDRPVESGAATGGVWKTTNFLTSDPIGPTWSRPGVGMLRSLDGGTTWPANAVPIRRISLTPGGGGVEGHDVAAKMKVAQLINYARGGGLNGKLYVATDTGVFSATNQSRLTQIGQAIHNSASVEVIVTDAGGSVLSLHRLHNVSVSGSSGTFTLTFNGQTTGG